VIAASSPRWSEASGGLVVRVVQAKVAVCMLLNKL
jgi:hypothetical protein